MAISLPSSVILVQHDDGVVRLVARVVWGRADLHDLGVWRQHVMRGRELDDGAVHMLVHDQRVRLQRRVRQIQLRLLRQQLLNQQKPQNKVDGMINDQRVRLQRRVRQIQLRLLRQQLLNQ